MMLPMKDQVPRRSDPAPWRRRNLHREVRVAKGFGRVDFPVRILVRADHAGGKELPVWVDGCRECSRKPVQRDCL